MPRLFIAIDIPAAIASKLALLQPPPAAGVRPTALKQMHLTLHFIGEAKVAPVADALLQVEAPIFSIHLDKQGRFHSQNGGSALWAGVQPNRQLLELHEAVLAALASAGLKPKLRAYTPHITLARCRPDTPAHIVSDFLSQETPMPSEAMRVTHFSLYSSILTSEGSQYTCEHSFSLHDLPG